jgi:ubiquinone/menaquinone biosynthesis C-methylase UbiE
VKALDGELGPRTTGRCLELGPRSPQVFCGYLSDRGWHYTGADRWDIRCSADPEAFGSFVHHDADATDLNFAVSGGYELFIAQQVIEAVIDYPAALDEAARVLEPGGRALLQVVWDANRTESLRRPRDKHGSVWSFGQDWVQGLHRRFAQVEVVPLVEDQYSGSLFVCRRAR